MALSIVYWAKFVEGHTKLTRKSEAAVESGRVLRFVMDELRVITDTSYKVQVHYCCTWLWSLLIWILFFFALKVRLWNKFLSGVCIIVWYNFCIYFWTLKRTALWKISHVIALWGSLNATMWLQHCCLGKERKLVGEIINLIVLLSTNMYSCIFVYFRYRRASKTDVKCSWLKHTKSAPPKSTVTMSDLYPPKQQYISLL